jgi:hypothetical protein
VDLYTVQKAYISNKNKKFFLCPADMGAT